MSSGQSKFAKEKAHVVSEDERVLDYGKKQVCVFN
jgi:hypothetical protein